MLTREEYQDKQNLQNVKKSATTEPNHQSTTWKIFKMLFLLVVMAILAGSGLFFYYISSAPRINRNAMQNDNAVQIYDNQGHLISRLGAQNRDYVKYQDIPSNLVNGLTSIEDRHFFKENGVDPIRIMEAEFSNLIGHDGIQGGSTLTQQLVKLTVFSTSAKDRTMKKKAQETWLALKVDRKVPKDKILEYYINKVYMGHNAYGMQTASKYYFNKPLSQLSIAQDALLAGMPQSPVNYDPYAHPKLAEQRRNNVITAMFKNHKISRQQADNALGTPISYGLVHNHSEVNASNKKEKIANDYIKQTVDELVSKGYNLHSGMKVYTNLNMKDQTQMYNLANNSKKPGWPNDKLQVGATLVNSHNGNVEAMMGGRKESQLFGLNRATQTSHSNGSTNKPLMDYGPAIQYLHYSPDRTVEDTPFVYPGTHIELKDFDHQYKGAMTMRNALVQSRNVPAIRTLQEVGVPRARKFMDGLNLHTNPKKTSLQNGIGGYISSMQEAAAYAAFANGGTYHQPLEINHIVTNTGQTRYFHAKSNRAMSTRTAYEINEMLKGVPESSDGDHAKVEGLHEAGKTGTTQYPSSYKYSLPNYAVMDSWYEGYTPNLSLSVWTGYDQPMKPHHYLNANQINIAQEYYKYVMELASEQVPNSDWH